MFPQPLKPGNLTQQRTIINFDQKHPGGVGGLIKKIEADPPPTLAELGKQYGRTQQRMSAIVAVLLGIRYSDYLARRRVNRQHIQIKEAE